MAILSHNTWSGKLRFVWNGTFDERLLPKEAGFRWDPANKKWWTDDPKKASVLLKYANGDTASLIENMVAEIKATLAASAATDSHIEIPCPPDLEYMPFQKAGIAYARPRPSTLIGDEMGLGKTIQALGLINACPGEIETALIICPASLKLNWKREADKWLVREMPVTIVGSRGFDERAPIWIINYDVLKKHRSELRAREWDLMVIDEAQYVKNAKAIRSKEVLGYKALDPIPAKRKLFLTGTPILNRPKELWNIARSIAPEVFRSWKYFHTRYCDAYQDRWGWNIDGASNLDELQEKLRLNGMVRRLKADVLKELPAKRRQVIELPENGCARVIKKEQAAWDAKLKEIDAARKTVEALDPGTAADEYAEAVARLGDVERVAFDEMAKLRHDTALAKAPTVANYIKDVVENGEKVVVFAHHHDVVDVLREVLELENIRSVVITGRTEMTARQRAVDTFQTDDDVRVFIGNIKAAGTGLTLTAASHVIFAELDWTPGNITQAEDRCHRIGQTDSVLVQHLVLDGTLDARMAHMLVKKQAVIDKALDSPIEEEVVDLSWAEAMIGKKTRARKMAEVSLSDDAKDAIHEGLRLLAGVCDGAARKDDVGFNAFDAQFGRQLAGMESLTPLQYVAARNMIRKYVRQLGEDLVSRMYDVKQKGGEK